MSEYVPAIAALVGFIVGYAAVLGFAYWWDR